MFFGAITPSEALLQDHAESNSIDDHDISTVLLDPTLAMDASRMEPLVVEYFTQRREALGLLAAGFLHPRTCGRPFWSVAVSSPHVALDVVHAVQNILCGRSRVATASLQTLVVPPLGVRCLTPDVCARVVRRLEKMLCEETDVDERIPGGVAPPEEDAFDIPYPKDSDAFITILQCAALVVRAGIAHGGCLESEIIRLAHLLFRESVMDRWSLVSCSLHVIFFELLLHPLGRRAIFDSLALESHDTFLVRWISTILSVETVELFPKDGDTGRRVEALLPHLVRTDLLKESGEDGGMASAWLSLVHPFSPPQLLRLPPTPCDAFIERLVPLLVHPSQLPETLAAGGTGYAGIVSRVARVRMARVFFFAILSSTWEHSTKRAVMENVVGPLIDGLRVALTTPKVLPKLHGMVLNEVTIAVLEWMLFAHDISPKWNADVVRKLAPSSIAAIWKKSSLGASHHAKGYTTVFAALAAHATHHAWLCDAAALVCGVKHYEREVLSMVLDSSSALPRRSSLGDIEREDDAGSSPLGLSNERTTGGASPRTEPTWRQLIALESRPARRDSMDDSSGPGTPVLTADGGPSPTGRSFSTDSVFAPLSLPTNFALQLGGTQATAVDLFASGAFATNPPTLPTTSDTPAATSPMMNGEGEYFL